MQATNPKQQKNQINFVLPVTPVEREAIIMANNTKKKGISNYVAVIKARNNKVARRIMHTYKNKETEFITDAEGGNIPNALGIAAMTIQQALDGQMAGQLNIILPDDAAIRAFECTRVFKDFDGDVDKTVQKLVKDWMSEEWLDAIGDFVEMHASIQEQDKLKVVFTKASELYYYGVTAEEGTELSDGMKIHLVSTKDEETGHRISATEDGNIVCSDPFQDGDFTVHEYKVTNPQTQEESISYQIDRTPVADENGNYDESNLSPFQIHLLNVRDVERATRDMLPSIQRRNSDTVEVAEGF